MGFPFFVYNYCAKIAHNSSAYFSDNYLANKNPITNISGIRAIRIWWGNYPETFGHMQ